MKKLNSIFVILFTLLSFSIKAQFITVDTNAVNLGGGYYQLTTPYNGETGYVWHQLPHDLTKPLNVVARMNFGANAGGADGITFVIQNQCAGASGTAGGGGIGYYKMPGKSIGIEFDTYQNVNTPLTTPPVITGTENYGDPVYNHIAIEKDGVLDHANLATVIMSPIQMHPTQTNLKDGLWHDVVINYDPVTKLLNVSFDGYPRIVNFLYDIQTNIFGGEQYVYWGFSSSTGGKNNKQQLYIDDNLTSAVLDDTTICLANGPVSFKRSLPSLSAFSGKNLAFNKTTYVSTLQNPTGNQGYKAVDQTLNTGWESTWALDNQYIIVDLGSLYDIDSVSLFWETAAAKKYSIDFSTDMTSWTTSVTVTNGTAGWRLLTTPATNVRYVRMYGFTRTTVTYGFHLYEFRILGKPKYIWSANPVSQTSTISDVYSPNPTFSPTQATTYSVAIPDPCLPSSTASFKVTLYCPLPLTFLSLDLTKSDNKVLVNWKTTNEINTSYFIIEKSDENGVFSQIGNLQAMNRSGINTYSFIDKDLSNGTSYYRIVQYDIDGKFEYSFIKSITNNDLDIEVSPNPSNGIFEIKNIDEIIELSVINVLGQVVLYTTNNTILDLTIFASGTYILYLKTNTKIYTKKIIKY